MTLERTRTIQIMTDLHVLAGRGPLRAVTDFVNRRIFKELAFRRGDCFVDIGCGDGLLLRLALENGVATAVGLNAMEDETRPLRACGLDVRQA